MANEDDEVVEYVRSLEERATEVDLSQANGDQIAREFERYLRRRALLTGGRRSARRAECGPEGPRRRDAAARARDAPAAATSAADRRSSGVIRAVASASKSRSCMVSANRSVIPDT